MISFSPSGTSKLPPLSSLEYLTLTSLASRSRPGCCCVVTISTKLKTNLFGFGDGIFLECEDFGGQSDESFPCLRFFSFSF